MSPFDALWTFPGIIISAFIIAWAAETSQFLVSQGMALAILAWLQTLPEFAVEAVITWKAGSDPSKLHLITANFTGSIRLLIGLGWPVVYFISFFSSGMKRNGLKHRIILKGEHSVEVIFLALGVIFWLVMLFSKRLTIHFGVIFIASYFLYLFFLSKLPPEEEHEEVADFIKKILQRGKKFAGISATLMFIGGGVALYFLAEPFLESMLALAVFLGVREFYFIQWVAPFLSEFPEKVSAFNWARRERFEGMGILNLVSSTINQTSLLVGIIPFVFAFSKGVIEPILFDPEQLFEIELTLSQVIVGALILFDMDFSFSDATLMLFLWLVQFIFPFLRIYVLFGFWIWALLEIFHLLRENKVSVFYELKDKVLKKYFVR